jgi:hypothetical protein
MGCRLICEVNHQKYFEDFRCLIKKIEIFPNFQAGNFPTEQKVSNLLAVLEALCEVSNNI